MRFLTPFRAAVIGIAVIAWTYAPHAQPRPDGTADLAELWQEPADLLQRDLFYGPGGAALAPPADGTYQFVAYKTTGTNPGYDVKDASGRLWSVKLGIEAQSEVTSSRILWAMGFPQPATYYLPQFTLTGTDAGVKTQARFRTEVAQWRAGGEWSWYQNPFVGTQQFRGLVVAQLVLNNWDMKTPNNRLYEATDPSAMPRRQYVVRDVGSSLGHSRQHILFATLGTRGAQGSKNNIDDFERQGFIERVAGDKVDFDYRGMNQALVDTVTVADVIWACEQLAKIPDGHWQAAFKAGDYPQADADRYIRKIKDKIAQGLALKTASTR
ncbi:MAG TPA: hypothetical protein VFZ31_11765 [Vicinamibacterales bacterium]